MLNIGATGTIFGLAGTAAAITYTLSGMEKNTSSGLESYKILGQGQLSASGDVLYTAGSASAAFVKEILLSNTTANLVSGIKFFVNGTGSAYQIFRVGIPAYGSAIYGEEGIKVYDSGGALAPSSAIARLPAFYDAESDFGFVGDLKTLWDGTCATATPTKITSASAPFVSADVGKRITLAGAGTSSGTYAGVITAVDSSSQVTVSPDISIGVSSKGMSFGTDNTAAITLMQNTVNNATYPGARIIFGQSETNSYGFPTPVTFNKTVQIEGIGGGHNTDSGDYVKIGGTRLAWWGTSRDGGVGFGAFFSVSPTGAQSLKRVAFRHCWLDCRNGDQNEALIGLKLASCHGFMLEDFFIMDAAAIALWTDIDSDPSEAKDTTRFGINNMCIRQLDACSGPAATLTPTTTTTAATLTTTGQSFTLAAANGLTATGYVWMMTTIGQPILVKYTGGGGTTTLTGCVVAAECTVNAPTTVSGSNVVQADPSNACGIFYNGGTGANTCCGVVQMVQISHGTTWGPAGIEHGNSDSIRCTQVMTNGGSATSDGAINRIRKPGIRFNGSSTSDTLAARNNHYCDGDPGAGGVSVMGVNNAGTRLAYLPTANYYDAMQMGNGAPVPAVEGSAFLDWWPNGGWQHGVKSPVAVADQAISAATSTLITGSLTVAPPQGWRIGTTIRWNIILTKTAAGVNPSSFYIRIGTNGTTADSAVCTFTTGSGSAVADTAHIHILATVRGPLGGSCVLQGNFQMTHNLSSTGWLIIPAACINASGTFASTTAQQFISVSVTTGTSVAPTVQQCQVKIENPSN